MSRVDGVRAQTPEDARHDSAVRLQPVADADGVQRRQALRRVRGEQRDLRRRESNGPRAVERGNLKTARRPTIWFPGTSARSFISPFVKSMTFGKVRQRRAPSRSPTNTCLRPPPQIVLRSAIFLITGADALTT